MKDKIDTIKDIFNDPKKKAYAFFGFYFVFFIFVFVFLKSVDRKHYRYEDYELGKKFTYNSENIKNNNYSFNYSVKLDDITYLYNGKKNSNSELFNYNDKEYYRLNDNYFINNDIWVKCDDPYKFSLFMNIDNIVLLLDSSYFESKTVYEEGKTVYNLLISSNTINKIISNIDSDYEEVPNKVVLTVDKDKNITDISFVLDSYCVLTKKCDKSLSIDLSYSDFGNIEDIKNPIGE